MPISIAGRETGRTRGTGTSARTSPILKRRWMTNGGRSPLYCYTATGIKLATHLAGKENNAAALIPPRTLHGTPSLQVAVR